MSDKTKKTKHKGSRLHDMEQDYCGYSDIHLFDLSVQRLYVARYRCDCGYELQYLADKPDDILRMPKNMLVREDKHAD